MEMFSMGSVWMNEFIHSFIFKVSNACFRTDDLDLDLDLDLSLGLDLRKKFIPETFAPSSVGTLTF